MKKALQFFLSFILIVIAIFFYKNYLKEDYKVQNIDQFNELSQFQGNKEKSKEGDNKSEEIQSNLIKNLKYDVKFEDNSQYSISADFSELTYIENDEIVNMTGVKAIIIDENNFYLIITSNNAVFNNTTYNTIFNDNVKVSYLTNKISSQKLELDFEKNIVTITDNVVYEGLQGFVKTDNIKIYLLTKNVEIFMNDKKEKIKITSKN